MACRLISLIAPRSTCSKARPTPAGSCSTCGKGDFLMDGVAQAGYAARLEAQGYVVVGGDDGFAVLRSP